jgi:hypothetical protein
MTSDQILLYTFIAVVVGAAASLILVLYTPFGRDVWGWVKRLGTVVALRVSAWGKAFGGSVRKRRLFWVCLCLAVAFWTLAGNLAVWIPSLDLKGTNGIALIVAMTVTLLGLGIALNQSEDTPRATGQPMQAESATSAKEDDSATALVAADKNLESVRKQLYAAVAAVEKYTDLEGYTNFDHVAPINALIMRLYAEGGEDLTEFTIPDRWNEGGWVRSAVLLPRLETLLVYLGPTV